MLMSNRLAAWSLGQEPKETSDLILEFRYDRGGTASIYTGIHVWIPRFRLTEILAKRDPYYSATMTFENLPVPPGTSVAVNTSGDDTIPALVYVKTRARDDRSKVEPIILKLKSLFALQWRYALGGGIVLGGITGGILGTYVFKQGTFWKNAATWAAIGGAAKVISLAIRSATRD